MITYIDQPKADDIDSGWAGDATQAEIDNALLQANVWLNAQHIVDFGDQDIPLSVSWAGLELAKVALKNELWTTSEKVSSKTVSAKSGTSVSKTYAEPVDNESRDLKYVRALLQPYVISGIHFKVDRG